MSLYVNGASNARVTVFDLSTKEQTEVIDLDLCGFTAGQVEDYEEEFKRNKTEQGKLIDFDFKASRILFTLDYSEDIEKANSFDIEKIAFYNSLPDRYQLILTPRVDILRRTFEVRLYDGKYSQGIDVGGVDAKGNTLTVIKFITVYPVGKNFIDPLDVIAPMPFYGT